jgi:sugar phosphate isomerase/epimerase
MPTDRRSFFVQAGVVSSLAAATAPKDQISLAAWSLVNSFFLARKWTNLDLPRITREEFGIGALEFVNQFFDNPMMTNLQRLKKNAAQYDVKLVRIMVDDEGNMAAIDKLERMQSAVAHRKWVDIAHYLGCIDIRCNMRGGLPNWREDKDLVSRAAESFVDLLEYSHGSGLDIIIENHGGASSNADILVSLMKMVNNPRFGTLPDFGNINAEDDRYATIRKIVPYAKGVSVKAAWKEDDTHPGWDLAKLIQICRDAGFHGYWGIECSYGRRAVRKPDQPVDPAQIWANELKGVRLTKAVLERALA